MLKRFSIVAAVFLSAKIWALNCSAPTTLSDPSFDAVYSTVHANNQGDAAVFWEVRNQKRNSKIEAVHKIKSSDWSSPESVSAWEGYIDFKRGFIDSNGNVLVVWQGDDELPLQTAEKKLEGSWTPPMDMFVSDHYPHPAFALDSSGQIICVDVQKKTIFVPPIYSWERTREQSISVLAVKSWAPSQTENEWKLFENEEQSYISRKILLSNQSGVTYIFWICGNGNSNELRAQKMQEGQFVSDTEIIYSQLPSIGYSLKGSMNEKGHIALVWEDREDNLVITTYFNDTWSEPETLSANEDDPYRIQVSIDNNDNIMVVYESEFEEMACVKAIYKPYGQPWMDPVQFSDPDRDNQRHKIQSDLQGNFVLIWEKEARKRRAIFGASFSTTEQKWSTPILLSPNNQSCKKSSSVFWGPGKGYITWTSTNGFESCVQVAELSN